MTAHNRDRSRPSDADTHTRDLLKACPAAEEIRQPVRDDQKPPVTGFLALLGTTFEIISKQPGSPIFRRVGTALAEQRSNWELANSAAVG